MNRELETQNAIVKILKELLVDDYPQIIEVQSTSDTYEFPTDDGLGREKHYRYTVYLGIKYGDMLAMSFDDINDMKNEAKRYSRYVMGKNEKVEKVVVYDPANSEIHDWV
jgi:hypothetical protein